MWVYIYSRALEDHRQTAVGDGITQGKGDFICPEGEAEVKVHFASSLTSVDCSD